MTFNKLSIRDLLRGHGIRPTASRVAIAEVFLNKPQHCSADGLHERLNKERRRVSLATVYNTLKLFTDHGLVRELRVARDRVMYDSNTAPHHHFYNQDTGRLEDIPAAKVRVSGLPRVPNGTVQDGVDVVVRLRRKKRRASKDKRL